MPKNFEPHECVIFVQSTKIGAHENKSIYNFNHIQILVPLTFRVYYFHTNNKDNALDKESIYIHYCLSVTTRDFVFPPFS